MLIIRYSMVVIILVLFVIVTSAQQSNPEREKLEKFFSQRGFKYGEDRQIIAMGDVAKEFLLEKLKSKDSYERGKALIVLGRMGGSDLVEPVTNFLNDPDKDVVFRAAQALGDIGLKEGVPPLCKALESKNGYEGNAMILSALLKIGDASCIEELKTFAALCKDDGYQREKVKDIVLRLERYYGGEDSRRKLLEGLLELAEDATEEEVFWALRRIQESKVQKYIPALRKLYQRLKISGPGGFYNIREEPLKVIKDLGGTLTAEEEAVLLPKS